MSGAHRFFWCVLRLGFAYPKKYKLEKERNTMNKVEDFINTTKLNDLLNKKEELINMTKLNELLNKKSRRKENIKGCMDFCNHRYYCSSCSSSIWRISFLYTRLFGRF